MRESQCVGRATASVGRRHKTVHERTPRPATLVPCDQLRTQGHRDPPRRASVPLPAVQSPRRTPRSQAWAASNLRSFIKAHE